MIPRSLQNFMNAFTSLDHTMYPFATTNAQDFRNLMHVYLDATLRPLLKQSDFLQEGWRIGPENPKAASPEGGKKDLTYKGVVYNEMKGQYSDANYLFYIQFLEHFFPSINNSGGDPRQMIGLTYDQLRAFHQAHYHPSNSKIVTYGDQPFLHHLSLLGEQLASFGKVETELGRRSPIDLANGPRHHTVEGPVDPLTPANAQYRTSVTWAAGDATNVSEAFAMQIASSLLLDGYGSPLYRALIESGLGTDFSPNTGYDSISRSGMFSIGLSGVTEENVPLVHQTIAATLRQAANNGFPQQKIDGLLHQMELGLKHKNAMFGLNLVQRLKPQWFNGIDPFDALQWDEIVSRFKAEQSKGGYLEGLLTKYLLTDRHFTFTMVPKEAYGADLAAEEAATLDHTITASVRGFPNEEEGFRHLRERELELVKEQEAGQMQPLDCLPTLQMSDIPRQSRKYETRESHVEGTAVQWRETATNGLTYFRALSLFQNLPRELRMFLPLFCDGLMRIGTRRQSMEELEDQIKLKTGGLSFSYHANASPDDVDQAEEGLALSGHALDGNVPAMYELFQTILVETDFDSPKARQMIRQLLQTSAGGAVDAIANGGHIYARTYALAGLAPANAWAEETNGLTQIGLITSVAVAQEDSDTISDVMSKLKALQTIAVSNLTTHARVALTCGSEASPANEQALRRFLSSTSTPSHPPSVTRSPPAPISMGSPTKTFFPLPYQVSYSALALPAAPYTSPSSAPLTVLASLLTHRHLLHEVREKGGAYGAGAFHSPGAGAFGMYSYRDPNPSNTLQRVWADAGRWAAERDWTARELSEAKLSVFQTLDRPVSVDAEAMARFLSGVTPAMQQQRRERLLDVDARQVREAAEWVHEGVAGGAHVALLGECKGLVGQGGGWITRDLGLAAAPPAGPS